MASLIREVLDGATLAPSPGKLNWQPAVSYAPDSVRRLGLFFTRYDHAQAAARFALEHDPAARAAPVFLVFAPG